MSSNGRGGRRRSAAGVVLRLLVVAALVVSAYLHVVLAPDFDLVGERVTLGDLFRVQAVVATVSALWLLIRGSRAAWLFAAGVGLGSLVPLVVSVYVEIPAFGPFPSLFEPVWYTEKVVAAVAAGAAGFGALPGALRRPTQP